VKRVQNSDTAAPKAGDWNDTVVWDRYFGNLGNVAVVVYTYEVVALRTAALPQAASVRRILGFPKSQTAVWALGKRRAVAPTRAPSWALVCHVLADPIAALTPSKTIRKKLRPLVVW
jgi:hypothetical protein